MIVPSAYENQVIKVPINAANAVLSFTESGVFMIEVCWVQRKPRPPV